MSNYLIELGACLLWMVMVYGCNWYVVQAKKDTKKMCDMLYVLVNAQDKQLIHTSDEMVRLNAAHVGAVDVLTDRVRTHAKRLSAFQVEQQRDVKIIEQDVANLGQKHETLTADLTCNMVINNEHFKQVDNRIESLRVYATKINEITKNHESQLDELMKAPA